MKYKKPSFLQSIPPIIFLVVMLSINVFIFGGLGLLLEPPLPRLTIPDMALSIFCMAELQDPPKKNNI